MTIQFHRSRFLHTSFAALLLIGAESSLAQTQWCNNTFGLHATNTTQGVSSNICTSTAQEFISGINNNFGLLTYTNTDAVTINGVFNNVNIDLSSAANSTTVSVSIPQLGVTQSFVGTTRLDAQQQLVSYLQKNNILGQILKYQAMNFPTSVISGMGGLMPTMIAQDFSTTMNTSSKIATVSQTGKEGNLVGLGLNYGSYSVSGSSNQITTTTLPLSYSIRSDSDSRRELTLSLPITQVSVGEAKSYHTGFGASYRMPVKDNWTLVPAARYSVVASIDQATAATLMSGSISSNYVISTEKLDLAIGNMLGYYKTGNFSAGDYSVNPDITQVATRNGVLLSQPVTLWGEPLAFEYSLIDTRYIGNDKPFLDNMQEAGFTVGTNKKVATTKSFSRFGISYITGPSTNGFQVNAGYWF
jgi:hypothetical protein